MKDIKMFTWTLRVTLALPIALVMLQACDGSASRESELGEEVAAVSEFDVGHRPVPSANDLVRIVMATGGLAEADALPIYSDITFFPIVHADALEAMRAGPRQLRARDIEPDLSGIDFANEFALLVAHPDASSSYKALSSGQHAMYLSSIKVSYPEGRVVVHVSASRMGTLDPMTALSARWKGKIYRLERRERDELEVRLYEDSYVFALTDAGPQPAE